jgi:hypothetical protein
MQACAASSFEGEKEESWKGKEERAWLWRAESFRDGVKGNSGREAENSKKTSLRSTVPTVDSDGSCLL